jgi:aspartyl/asparaginyl beta-hydroxylase (cupin superfamily)
MKAFFFNLSLLPLKGVNALFDLHTGGRQRRVFFDIDQTFPELRQIDQKYEAIRGELLAILPEKDNIPRYHELDEGQHDISAKTERDWKVFMLYAMGEKPEANRAKCPETCQVLDAIPNLFQAFFSILEPGKYVPPHCGPYRGYLRYHLGLKVPKHNQPSIRVKDQRYTWVEGESVLFDDSWEHEVRNDSEEIRVVLIVDVLRPMPYPFMLANRAVTGIIRRLYARGLAKKLKLL